MNAHELMQGYATECVRLQDRNAKLIAALEQIGRLSREANRQAVDVASMLGEIARKALTE